MLNELEKKINLSVYYNVKRIKFTWKLVQPNSGSRFNMEMSVSLMHFGITMENSEQNASMCNLPSETVSQCFFKLEKLYSNTDRLGLESHARCMTVFSTKVKVAFGEFFKQLPRKKSREQKICFFALKLVVG